MPPPEPRSPPPDTALYDEAPCGLLLTRTDGTIERVNHTFCRWIGWPEAELVGLRRFQDLLTTGGRIFHQTHFAPLLQMQGSVAEVKLDLAPAQGAPLPVLVNAVRVPGDGEVRHAIAVFVATERHAYERELMLSRRRAEELLARQHETQEQLREADRRKDEFLAMLAHELRNPLAPIAMASELLRTTADDPARVRQVNAVIGRQIAHLTHLVDDLLDVSRVTRGLIELERVPVDVADALAAALEQARPLLDAHAHALDVRAEPGLVVDGDRTRLVQVIANLLNNAAKYTPRGGRVAIELQAIAGEARLVVADDGIGIDATLLPRVFELFTQAERTPDRAQGGLGIGLALVRSLVVLHRGRVEAYSDGANRGSRFVVHLPLAERHAPVDAAPPPPPRDGQPSALYVLVVDDNVDASATLAEVVRLGGHRVDCAGSGIEALARVGAHAPPDICILDIGLPDMSGHELARRILEALPGRSPLLVALTGYGQPADIARSVDAGFTHHLVKPADVAEILALLDNHARRGDGPARAPLPKPGVVGEA